MVGKSLGHYEILESLGSGGMGEVYRAHDTKLEREVAIKLLPEALSSVESSLGRFQREARLLAAVNHSNIAAIHDLEEAHGTWFLVLELVEGETLAERLKRERLEVGEALEICLQVARGLEAAHAKGIVHRDLKPANVKLTPEGEVKVLDFGLAKSFVGSADEEQAVAETIPADATEPGAILGTFAYMSPEQARGMLVDKRADIWGFGCLAYEALAGRPAFTGMTNSDLLAAILKEQPDWTRLPDETPVLVRHLLRRCLEKDPELRLHDIADARIELVSAIDDPEGTLPGLVPSISAGATSRRALPWGLAGLLVLTAVVLGVLLGISIDLREPPVPTEIPVGLPAGVELVYENYPSLAISPDGRKLVYLGQSNGERRLYLQELDPRGDNRPIEGTEGATTPFFSPDGEWLGFFTRDSADDGGGKLNKVALIGGSVVELSEAANFWGASWTPDDEILFSASFSVMRVPAHGGPPATVTAPDRDRGEFSLTWPQMLPGGKEVLYTVAADRIGSRIAVTSMESGQQTVLFEGGIYARYVPTGHIVFAQGSSLMAMPFDLERLEVGAPVRVLDDVVSRLWDAAQWDVSENGSLVYLSGSPDPGGILVRIDADGTRRPLTAERLSYVSDLRISPDGQRIALEILAQDGGDIWIYELSRDDFSRLTFQPGFEGEPVWTPDGQRIAFEGEPVRQPHLSWISADGSGSPEPLVTTGGVPSSFSPDAKLLAFVKSHPDTGDDIWIHSIGQPDASEEFLATPFNERSPVFSPEGRWIAYQSDQTGTSEIYVQPYPGSGRTSKVSTAGGREPRWSSDGTRIFYREGNRAMVVTVDQGTGSLTSLPELLVDGLGSRWDVSPDGAYVVTVEGAPREPPRLKLVLDWFDDLKERVAR